MAQNLNLHGSTGLPVCLSGITKNLAFCREIADHDRRRKVLKKMKIVGVREGSTRRRPERIVLEDEEAAADLAGCLNAFSCISLNSCTAKAA